MSDQSLQEQLKGQIDESDWESIGPHNERGAVVVVHQDLDIVEVALAVAEDRVDQVQQWLKEDQVYKPDDAFVQSVQATPERRFVFLIVQPYVLVQEKAN